MKSVLRYMTWGAAGFVAGLTVAQIVIITIQRAGGLPGGEIIIPLGIPLLLLAGYMVGRDTPRIADYDRGYDDGYRDAAGDTPRPHDQSGR